MNSQNNPLVSIIIPVYNVAPYISECIESIQAQTYSNIEILVIDDGSTDGSGELCEKHAAHDDRIQVIHQKNAGVVSARARGIEASRGKYLSFIDGDDWVEPDTIESMVRDIGEADLISTKIRRELKPGKWVEDYDRFPERGYYGEEELAKILERMIFDVTCEAVQDLTPGICNKLFLRKIIQKVYTEVNPQITFAEDTVLLYKYILNCHSIVISHKAFYHYRYRDDSAVHRIDKHRLININQVYLALEDDFKKHKLQACLTLQLQKWIMHMTCRAINEFMGFGCQVYIQEYITDISDLKNKRIILYGAGVAGKNAYRQLKKVGYPIVLWADQNYMLYQDMGLPVESPDEMFNQEYDVIFIAVAERALAQRIKEELIGKGIDGDRILWSEPEHLF